MKSLSQLAETRKIDEAKSKYDEFFEKKLKEYGVKSPAELDDSEKKKFFNEIEKEWTGDVNEGKTKDKLEEEEAEEEKDKEYSDDDKKKMKAEEEAEKEEDDKIEEEEEEKKEDDKDEDDKDKKVKKEDDEDEDDDEKVDEAIKNVKNVLVNEMGIDSELVESHLSEMLESIK